MNFPPLLLQFLIFNQNDPAQDFPDLSAECFGGSLPQILISFYPVIQHLLNLVEEHPIKPHNSGE